LLPSRIPPITNVREDAGKKEPSYTPVGMQASATTTENNMEASLKI
jgi:hypothetical protein